MTVFCTYSGRGLGFLCLNKSWSKIRSLTATIYLLTMVEPQVSMFIPLTNVNDNLDHVLDLLGE